MIGPRFNSFTTTSPMGANLHRKKRRNDDDDDVSYDDEYDYDDE